MNNVIFIKERVVVLVSLAQLVETIHNIYARFGVQMPITTKKKVVYGGS